MTGKPLAILISLVLLIAACGSDDPLSGPSTLEGSWQLAEASVDGQVIELLASHPVTIEFEDGRAAGTAACNGYGGTVNEAAGPLFEEMSITEMACFPPETMEVEAAYMTALSRVETYQFADDGLTLSGEGVSLVYEQLPPVPTADLTGTVWVLDGLISGDAVSSVSGERATLELFTDGSFLASTGCRSLHGTYVEAAGSIATATMTATGECSSELTPQDSHVVSVLEGPYRAEIDGQRLTLGIAGDEGLTYTTDN